MSDNFTPEEEALLTAVRAYFAQAVSYDDLTQERCAAYLSMTRMMFQRRFTPHCWTQMRAAWAREHFLAALDSVASQVKTRHELTVRRIAHAAGISVDIVHRNFSAEWKARRSTLPSLKDVLEATMQEMLDLGCPPEAFTRLQILRSAHLSNNKRYSTWLRKARKAAALEAGRKTVAALTSSQVENHATPLESLSVAQEVWILHFADGCTNTLRKSRLRADIAEVAWPFLHRELMEGELSVGTIVQHFRMFVVAGAVLGSQAPDIRQAKLEQIQSAWVRFGASSRQRAAARWGLVQLFKHLQADCQHFDAQECRAIVDWLTLLLHIPVAKHGEVFLSEQEVASLIRACANDILAGQAYVQEHPNFLELDKLARSPNGPLPLIRWTGALLCLLMLLTGLRPQSVRFIAFGDWIELKAGLHVLVWRHTKKGEEKLAILPDFLAELLTQYAETMHVVHRCINTEQLFLNLTPNGDWCPYRSEYYRVSLDNLVREHSLQRDGEPLPLTCQILRRTYATRALYAGQNIYAIRLQLGHARLSTTLSYMKHDRYVHPSQVRKAFDDYGKKALPLWHQPCLLKQLAPQERERIVLEGLEREQDVGWCCHTHCVKALEGSPPPCSLCENLITGPEFLPAWESEAQHRAAQLTYLANTPGAEMTLAQMKLQFEQFQVNHAYVKQEA